MPLAGAMNDAWNAAQPKSTGGLGAPIGAYGFLRAYFGSGDCSAVCAGFVDAFLFSWLVRVFVLFAAWRFALQHFGLLLSVRLFPRPPCVASFSPGLDDNFRAL